MQIRKLTESQRSIVESNNGLMMYLNNLTQEQPATKPSWLADNVKPEVILQNWLRTLKSLENGTDCDRKVFQFDTSQLEKWGPQGGHPPMKEAFDEVFGNSFRITNPSDAPWHQSARSSAFANWCRAKRIVTDEVTTYAHSLRPASYGNVSVDMAARDVLDSNSGYPDFTRRKKPSVLARAISDAENGNWRDFPAIALFRNYNQKDRGVWMYPLATNLVEGSFYQPMASHLMSSPLAEQVFSPWMGFEQVRRVVTANYQSNSVCLAASDFSHTDETFGVELTLQVYDVIKYCFQSQYRDALKESLVHMHHIPLMIGPDAVVYGEHGVSSGSNWTNFIETVFDYIFGTYVALQRAYLTGAGVMPTRLLYAIGDDMAWRIDEKPSMLSFGDATTEQSDAFTWKQDLQIIGQSFGLEINPSKTMFEPDEVKTLQRLFIRGYRQENSDMLRGVYPTIRALKSSVYPERFHDVKKRKFSWENYFCCRQFMILENCVDHPLFEAFVRYVCSLHSALVPFAREAVEGKKDDVLKDSHSVPGLNPSYNQEKRNETSLAAFRSIQIAARSNDRGTQPAG